MSEHFGATAYVSYARKDEELHNVITNLESAFEAGGVHLKVDANEVKVRGSFDKYIKEIGAADCVVLVLSDHYLNSFYCMLEIANVFELGDVDSRTYQLFAEDSFRMDGKKDECKSHWKQKKSDWHDEANTPSDDEYGTLEECELILRHIDAIFDHFGRTVAGRLPANGLDVVEFTKSKYRKRVEDSSAFRNAIQHLDQCDLITKNSVGALIEDKAVTVSASAQIAYLSSLSIPKLIKFILDVQKSFTTKGLESDTTAKCIGELSQLLKNLLPALFSPAYAPKLKVQCDEVALVEIPFGTEISAEVLMAGIDGRSTDFIVRQMSQANTEARLYPGKFNLRLPPEVADGNVTEVIEDDLFRRLGLPDPQVGAILDSVEDHLASHFARLPSRREVTREQKRRLTQRGLSTLKTEHDTRYYWILEDNSSVGRERWSDFSSFIQQHYPEVVLLVLDSDFDKYDEEDELFKLLHRTLSS